MMFKLITAELEIYESDSFDAIYKVYCDCINRKVQAILYKAENVFLEYIPKRYSL